MSFNIVIDYRFDSTGFFNNAGARAAMEESARIWESIILDEFEDVPAGVTFTVSNPSNSAVRETVTLTEAIDDLIIFVGAESLGGPLGRGGFAGVDASGDALRARVTQDWRGTGPVTDFEPWAGVVRFDPGVNWNFDLAGPVAGKNDFLTTALHEVGHVLGVGTAPIFDALIDTSNPAAPIFTGVNSTAANGGTPIPLDPDLGHVVDGFEGNTVLMDPTTTTGTRKMPTDIDRALLADIGYEIAGFTTQGSTPPIATEGADVTIFGMDIGDAIDGLGGDDRIQGEGGDDTLSGGAGNDTLFGQEGDDLLNGGDGDDALQGGSGNDTLVSSLGEDGMFGQDGTDTFRIVAGSGEANLFDFDLATEVIELVGSNFATEQAAADALTKPFSNVSRLTFSDGTFVDVFHTSQSGSPLTAAHFRIVENGLGQELSGTPGNDRLEGGAGNETIRGLDGSDTLIGGGGDDLIIGGATDADLRDVVFGGDGNDTIEGGAGNDELRGDAGNDDIAGGAGADTVIGGAGDDVMTGSNFGDVIFGGDGFDFVNGGFGNDRVNGGNDADRFFHVGVAGHGSDWIQDYDAAEGDVLLYGGSATIDQFQVNRANTANAGEASVDEAFVIYKPSGQILWALVDGFGNDAINIRISGVEYDLLG